MDRTIKEEIRDVVKRFCENDESVKNITNGVYDLMYDMPEDKVIVVKNNFKRMNTPFGIFYRFYNEDGTWGKPQFVRKVNNG